MKKKIALLVVVCMCMLALVACGEPKSVAGTWVLSGATMDGQEMTAEQISELGEYNIVFNDDGSAKFTAIGQTIDTTYILEGKIVSLGEEAASMELKVDGSEMTQTNDSNIMVFTKQ